jgi:hypothetical protein
MRLFSIRDLAAELARETDVESLSEQRVRVLVSQWASEIGAVKVGHAWIVPESGMALLVPKINVAKRPKGGRSSPKRKPTDDI